MPDPVTNGAAAPATAADETLFDPFEGMGEVDDSTPETPPPAAETAPVEPAPTTPPKADAAPPVAPQPAAPPTPAAAATAPTPQQEPPPAAPRTETPAPPAAATPQPTTPKALSPDDPNDVLTALSTDRRAFEAALGDQHFKLSEEEMGLLDSDPAAFVRLLGGRATYVAAVAGLGQLLKFAPSLIRAEIEASSQRTARATSAQERFRQMWPQLGTAHDKEVGEAIRNFRAINPSADMETALKVVGQLVAIQAGLSPQPAGAAPAAAASVPPVRQPAFVPAGTAVDVVPPTGEAGGMWDGLIEPID